jgi:hypothetical protein
MSYGDIPKKDFRYATGTTKKTPKEWESLVGKEFILYILNHK